MLGKKGGKIMDYEAAYRALMVETLALRAELRARDGEDEVKAGNEEGRGRGDGDMIDEAQEEGKAEEDGDEDDWQRVAKGAGDKDTEWLAQVAA